MSDLPPPFVPPPGYPPRGPQAGPPGWWSTTQDHPNGTTVLVLGILSLAVCGLLGPFAWMKGNRTLEEMDAQPGVTFANRGQVVAGRICGMVATAFLTLGLVMLALFLVLGIAAGVSGS